VATLRYQPQLATLVKQAPDGPEWLHEIKYDGYRIGCIVDRGAVRLVSRRGKDWTAQFPEIAEAAASLGVDGCVLDGEVAALRPDGRTSFQLLQNAFGGKRRPRLCYFVFDLLALDGKELTALPLEERKQRLATLLAGRKTDLVYASHVADDGAEVFAAACRQGLEGIVSKRRDGIYEEGRRGPSWVKTKCTLRQELVIGGVLDRKGSAGEYVGALLLGVHRDGELVYAGKVGTGYTAASARELRARLRPLEQPSCPFSRRPPGFVGRDAHWVRPELVCEVGFTEWTDAGHVRHPVFLGLRRDKAAAEVVEERPAPVAKATSPTVRGIAISHPDRLLYPELGLTKLDLCRYFDAIAEHMLPHVQGRPLTLLRCDPDISHGTFLRHGKAWGPSQLRRVRIREKTKVGEYLVADTPQALVALAQMGILEVHTWNSTAEHVEEPDRLVIDLDPGPEVAWSGLVAAAGLVRRVLDVLGLQSWVKTTGGVGLHVVVPLEPVHDWSACLSFSRAVCEAIERSAPSQYTTSFQKRGREGKVLLDYLRNNRTNTSVAAFSPRARPEGTVSAPLGWDELGPRRRTDAFTLRNILDRVRRQRRDPWRGYFACHQRLRNEALSALVDLEA
jgi:bifunctional non-homologous end joining protein LigD